MRQLRQRSLQVLVGAAVTALVAGTIHTVPATAAPPDTADTGPAAAPAAPAYLPPAEAPGATERRWPLLAHPFTAARAEAVLPRANERTPIAAAMLSQFQLQASPTRPESVMIKRLGTAGGRLTAWMEPLPDVDERAAKAPAGTAMVVSSDATKLTPSAKRTLMAVQPELTSLLMPVRGGKIEPGVNFRVTFQRGEQIRFAGKVTPDRKKSEVRVVLEKALIGQDGIRGPFQTVTSHTPNPDGSFESHITVNTGRQVYRHRLLIKTTVPSHRSGPGTARHNVTTFWKSFQTGLVDIVGTDVVTLHLYNQQSDDLAISMANVPTNGCNPTETTDCVYTSLDVTLNSGNTHTVTYVNPSEFTAVGFTMQKANGCVGKCSTYIPDWTAGVNGTSCSKMSPSPGTAMTPGTTWTITIQNQTTGYNAFLDSVSVNNQWSYAWSKGQQKGKYPKGCVFAIQTAFDNWVANTPTWLEVVVAVVVIVAITIATGGGDVIAALLWGTEAGADAALDAAADAAAEQVVTDTVLSEGQVADIEGQLDITLERGTDRVPGEFNLLNQSWNLTEQGVGKIREGMKSLRMTRLVV